MTVFSLMMKKLDGRSAGGNGGFSFVEAFFVTLTFMFIMAGLYSVLITGNNSWEITRDRIELQQSLRTGLDWMRKDLRQARASTLTGVPADGSWYASITFQIPSSVVSGGAVWSADIQYSVAGVGNQQLIRAIGLQQRVIAQRYTSVQFRRQASSPQIIEINAQVVKNTPQHGLISMVRSTRVTLRN